MNAIMKKISSQIDCRVIAALLLPFNLSCSNKTQSNMTSTAVASSPSIQSSSSSQEDQNITDDFPIVLAQNSGLPVSVVGLRLLSEGARKGDLQIQIKNV